MWSIALKTLVADRGKLLTALVGVIFSVVLVNIQGGLFFGLMRKASLLVDHGEADIWVGHQRMHNVDFPEDIPSRWVYRLRGVAGVRAAEPYVLGYSTMTLRGGAFETVLVVGCDRASLLGNAWEMAEGSPQDLATTDGIIVDDCEAEKLGHPRVGDLVEIGGRRARVAALSHGIMGFLVTPYVFTTLERASNYLHKSDRYCSYFLVRAEPGADPREVCAAIRRRLPEVEAMPKEDFGKTSVQFWMSRTGLGISFGSSTLLGLLVGLVIVAQTMYASVLDRIGEFGTLKAIGASERHIYSLLFTQAMSMALVGSLIGLGLVTSIQRLFSSPQAPIVIHNWVALGSCALVFAICLLSSALPYLRVRRVDPVMVLQG